MRRRILRESDNIVAGEARRKKNTKDLTRDLKARRIKHLKDLTRDLETRGDEDDVYAVCTSVRIARVACSLLSSIAAEACDIGDAMDDEKLGRDLILLSGGADNAYDEIKKKSKFLGNAAYDDYE